METKLMSKPTRKEYIRRIYDRYHKANKRNKNRMLDEITKVSGYHRKSVLRVLNGPHPEESRCLANGKTHLRKPRYSKQALQIIESIWETMDYPWSVRLTAILKEWLPHIRERYKMDEETERQLLLISARQIDRRLRDKKRQLKRRFYGTTKPGYLLKNKIAIRVKSWDIRTPGYLEIDTVAHCGGSLSGEFLYTVDTTDIRTGWVERRAILGKGEEVTTQALADIHGCLPFPLKGLDSDNGGEFINHHLFNYCKNHRLEFTRSRPQESKDQAHIEQKNFTHVRKMLGWQRYSSQQAQEKINELYQKPLRLLDNLFRPSVKLKSKKRIGSKIVRKYFPALSPLGRLAQCVGEDHAQVRALFDLRAKLDPFALAEEVQNKIEHIYSLADRKTLKQESIGTLALRQNQRSYLYVSNKQKKDRLIFLGKIKAKAA